MKIMPLSDIHYLHRLSREQEDYFPSYIDPNNYKNTDVVVVAGDIDKYPLQDLLPDSGHLIYVKGNHDYWYDHGISFDHPKIHLLDNSSVELNGVVFIGATLWTNLRNEFGGFSARSNITIRRSMNDFREIEGFTIDKWLELHEESYSFISKEVKVAKSAGKKVVVVTHHAPSYKSMHPDYAFNETNPAYFSELDLLGSDLWIHGHTHTSSDYLKDGTRVVCNPYGYFGLAGTNPRFNHHLKLDLERLDRYA